MSEYRDYGHIYGYGAGNPVPVDTKRYGQVYQATHNGERRLDYMYRSFISFSYGGKNIEDFNLIAYTNGDRMNYKSYAAFDDITSTYENLEGQQYWNTHFRANELELNLTTDGIDQRMLDDFLHWFMPGQAKELILAEHPNRAILARVSEPPQLSLLPFESKVVVKASKYSYTTSTTMFKGEIVLHLVMDSPHWYAIDNVLGIKEGNRYIDEWKTPNGEQISIFASQDALKILYEDGIPLGSMIQNDMLLGNGAFAQVEDNLSSKIWSESATQTPNLRDLTGGGACIDGTVNGVTYVGTIAGAIMDANGNGIASIPKGGYGYFYYSGTAPAPTILQFELQPNLENGYITVPYSSYTTPTHYNTITIESTTIQELRFTTPNIFTSYNKAIDIFKTYAINGHTWEEVREHLRDEVRHTYVREYAISVVNTASNNSTSAINSNQSSSLVNNMKAFLNGSGNKPAKAKFIFNSETGEATGEFSYKINGEFKTKIKENVGDMLRSNYIIIRDRNTPDDEGYIRAWDSNNKKLSHRIYHDVTGGLTNVQILYKNMYL